MDCRNRVSGVPPLARYFLLLFLLAGVPLTGNAAPIHAVFGEDIPLGGVAAGSDVVYLFLTGPNLPDQGISLAGGTTVTTGVPSSFTRVDVLTDGTWRYTWQTRSTGRILDPGTYTVYAVLQPVSRRDLAGADYTERAVVLGAPVETVTVPVPATTVPSAVITTALPPAPSTPSPAGTTPPVTGTSPGRLAPGVLIPLGASALAILAFHRRR